MSVLTCAVRKSLEERNIINRHVVPFSQCFAQDVSGPVDYMVIRRYEGGIHWPIQDDVPYTISGYTGYEDIVVDSAISSERVIGEILKNTAAIADVVVPLLHL